MTGELERVDNGPSWLPVLAGAAELARQIADTDFVPQHFRRKPAQIAAAILYGDEIGVGPMTALQHVAVINGRPAPSAQLGRALAISAGHRIWIDKASNTAVTACGQRRGDEHVHTVTFTIDDAKRAGIAGAAPWRKYPRAMLTARATSELIRTAFPDVLGGVTLFAEEAEDGDLEVDTAAPAAPPTEPTTKKKRAARKKTAAKKTATPDKKPDTTRQKRTEPDNRPALPPPPPDDDLLDDDGRDADVDVGGAARRRALFARFRETGYDDRDDRLAFTVASIGRNVSTSAQLTGDDVATVLAALDDIDAGRAGVVVDPDGQWRLVALEDDQ